MQICYISNGIIPHICSDCLGNTAELSKEQKIMQSELIIFFEHISLFFWLIRKKKAKSLWGRKKKKSIFLKPWFKSIFLYDLQVYSAILHKGPYRFHKNTNKEKTDADSIIKHFRKIILSYQVSHLKV
jgi:hypothetical protein